MSKANPPKVAHTVARIEQAAKRFTLNGTSVLQTLRFILAFLLHHGLLNARSHVLTDRQKSLQNTVLAFFGWYPGFWYTKLRTQLERVQSLHQKDLQEGFGEVYLPYALARKYPRAGRVGLAICLSGLQTLRRSALGQGAPPSHRRADPTAGGQAGRSGSRDRQARELSYPETAGSQGVR